MSSSLHDLFAEPVAYLNGEFVPLSLARIPVWDLGLVQAATVTEALRTFRSEVFRLDAHLHRLEFSLKALGLSPRESSDDLRRLITQLAAFNAPDDDRSELLVNLFITAGESAVHAGGYGSRPGQATVGITTRAIDVGSSSYLYRDGLALAIPSVRHIPASIIDPRIKYRSRLHWYLADREVQVSNPRAEALLLDLDGFVTETAKGNLFARFGDRFCTPSEFTTLHGVSQEVTIELCRARGIIVERADMTPEDLAAADELLVSSTSTCLVPVTSLNDRPVGEGRPGPFWRMLLEDWSKLVGCDLLPPDLESL